MDYTENIQRGIELLDQELPGWEHKVVLDELKLSDGCQCVLGQLAFDITGVEGTDYADAAEELFDYEDDEIGTDPQFYFGFSLGITEEPQQWGSLTKQWKKAIRAKIGDNG